MTPGPAGPAVVDADAPYRQPGKLRLTGNDPPAAMRTPSAGLAPLAIRRCCGTSTRTPSTPAQLRRARREPVVLPARFPNLLINGSEGIRSGWRPDPPHNLREVAAGVQSVPGHFETSDEELLDALIERVKGRLPHSG